MYTVTFQSERIEDLKEFTEAKENQRRIDDALNIIRTRIKHQNPSDEEHEVLKLIREALSE